MPRAHPPGLVGKAVAWLYVTLAVVLLVLAVLAIAGAV